MVRNSVSPVRAARLATAVPSMDGMVRERIICGTGFQSGWGTCTSSSPPPKVVFSKDGSCGGSKNLHVLGRSSVIVADKMFFLNIIVMIC